MTIGMTCCSDIPILLVLKQQGSGGRGETEVFMA